MSELLEAVICLQDDGRSASRNTKSQGLADRVAATTIDRSDQVAAIGMAAWIFGYPLVEFLRRCRVQPGTRFPSAQSRVRGTINLLQHGNAPPSVWLPSQCRGQRVHWYTEAWLNLSLGPSRLVLPAAAAGHGCSGTLSLRSAFDETFAEIHLEEARRDPSTILLLKPAGEAAEHHHQWVLRSPTNLLRLVIEIWPSSDRATDAIAYQQAIQLQSAPGATQRQRPAVVEMWEGDSVDPIADWLVGNAPAAKIAPSFYANLCRALTQLRTSTQDWEFSMSFKTARLAAGAEFNWDVIDNGTRQALVRGFEDAARWISSRDVGQTQSLRESWRQNIAMRYLERARATYTLSTSEHGTSSLMARERSDWD